jgi:hypothetical protein
MLSLAMDLIEKATPELAIVIKALERVSGANSLGGVGPNVEALVVRDIVGAMILLKILSNLGNHPAITIRCMEVSALFARLPQMSSVNPPDKPLESGRFSSVQLIDCIPKPN